MIRTKNATFEDGTWYFQIIGLASDGTIRLAAVDSADDPAAWLEAHQVEAQALIDAGNPASLRDEAKWYLINNPAAKNIIDLSGPDLEAAISDLIEAIFPNATADQRNKMRLLLTTLSYGERFLFESIRGNDV